MTNGPKSGRPQVPISWREIFSKAKNYLTQRHLWPAVQLTQLRAGFLPFVDLDNSAGASLSASPAEGSARSLGAQTMAEAAASGAIADARSPATRHNHAIWDQIGLLHWVRRNVAAFGGDAANVTLVSADNLAAHQLELLATSPMASGE